ncbi:DJ-1/PfpI family protein [Corynebacterium sp.]|uniref:oxidoreductase n=1 Tax=Corynebacterium sp. TaxID=1720 RepID=UPI0034C61A25
MTSVLFVVSAADSWTLSDGSKHPTGFWAEELAEPHRLFTDAGWDVVIATPGAQTPTLDQLSLGFAAGSKQKRESIKAYLDSIQDQLNHPVALEDVDEDEFDLVFYPGGHGPMEDLAVDETSGALLTRRIASGKPLALVCHAPAALLAARRADGSSPFAGFRLTALSNTEERLNKFAWKAPWLLEDRLRKIGAVYEKTAVPLRPFVVVDRNLYTGQNPASSAPLARRLITDLSSGTPPAKIFEPLELAHGAPLRNRLAKAAIEEDLGGREHLPNRRVCRLYETWSRGGVGLIITGNVMVDARACTTPNAIVLDKFAPLEPFREWARAAKSGGAQVWMQLSHPGRQIGRGMPGVKLAPSAVPLNLGANSKRFAIPKEMTHAEIEDVIERFVVTASRAADAGFDGVELHAAHGYLLSQFLSPLTNLRTDEWGGDLLGRSKVLREIVTRVRATVPEDFALGVKLNSADFQRGGFDVADASQVVHMLGELGVDLVEVSGGSYESPAMQGETRDQHTLDREAYFLKFAEEINQVASMPLMVTGGVTRRFTAERVLAAGVAMVGLGTALSLVPDLPNRWRNAELMAPTMPEPRLKDKGLNSLAKLVQVKHNLQRIADGKLPDPNAHPLRVLVADQIRSRKSLAEYKEWLAQRETATNDTSDRDTNG